jgi:transcriptional regulator with PAS, ATPase and Fis domain
MMAPRHEAQRAATADRAAFPSPPDERLLIGESAPIRKLRGYLDKLAVTDATVLITGETGTGKECVAEYLHRHSARAAKPLVSINCAALPEGLLESELFGHERGAFTGAERAFEGRFRLASGGTLFLDEIGDMSPHAQAKLLRAIEDHEVLPLGSRECKPVDVRLIAATNVEPLELLRSKRLRSDLYYRLNVVQVRLPPLRDRREDIYQLFVHFMRRRLPAGAPLPRISAEALARLLEHDWPGNVREVRNVIDHILVDPPDDEIGQDNLPESVRASGTTQPAPSTDERDRVIAVLAASHWNKSRAADILHWSRMTLYRKMAKLQISKHRSPPR